MPRILVLGGTTEASQLAQALSERGVDAVFSYAGRTAAPVAQPLPTRVGGFGGVEGLKAYLGDHSITAVVDATHPFAARMSANAVRACADAGVPLVAFERAPWVALRADTWTHVPGIPEAVTALPEEPARVFLAIGKQNLAKFAIRQQHHFLVRLVDAPEAPLPFEKVDVVVDRGPFDAAQDEALMQAHAIDLIVAKNSGGIGACAKLDAARALGLPVIMIDRPQVPERKVLANLEEVMDWLDHSARLGV